jgi:enolase-phosphatase E1
MIRVPCRGVLLDIEGTVAPLQFVTLILFPFARRQLGEFLERRWDDPAVGSACAQVARDAGADSLAAWAGTPDDAPQLARLVEHLHRLMDGDVKATGLKQLQGLIWEEGYAAGQLRSAVFADVPAALRDWAGRGIQARIYSSGSVTAQQVFFRHTEFGDLTPLLAGFYDTTTGPKREPGSYSRIVADMGLAAGEVLFVSDVVAELDAARAAGLQTALAVRPGNPPVPGPIEHPIVCSLAEVEFAG